MMRRLPLFVLSSCLPLLAASANAGDECVIRWIEDTSAGPGARHSAAAAYNPARQRTIMFGGRLASGFSDETWQFGLSGWVRLTPALSPSARMGHAMAHDSSRNRTVLFGGFPVAGSAQTWEFDGETWTLRTPTVSPPGRMYAAMCYQATSGKVLLFGGLSGGTVRDDTWEYADGQWTQRTTPLAPDPRYNAAMGFDPVRGVCVLHGGIGADLTARSDTWEWNGQNWSIISGFTPAGARAGHEVVWLAREGVLVMYGGTYSALNGAERLWFYLPSPGSWSDIALSPTPPARTNLVLAPGPAQSNLVLHGGQSSTNVTLGDTWLLGAFGVPMIRFDDQALRPGDVLSAGLEAPFPPELTFQWRRNTFALQNGGRISGANSAQLSIFPVVPGDAGEYTIEVTSICDGTISGGFTLDVLPACPGDENRDGTVDFFDLNSVLGNFGSPCE